MGFSFIQAQKFKVLNPELFRQIKASFTKIIQIDPTGAKDLISEAEALQVAIGVGELKSLAEANATVKKFFRDQFGKFDEMSEGQQGRNLFDYLESIDTGNCGATTIHTLLEPWAPINTVI